VSLAPRLSLLTCVRQIEAVSFLSPYLTTRSACSTSVRKKTGPSLKKLLTGYSPKSVVQNARSIGVQMPLGRTLGRIKHAKSSMFTGLGTVGRINWGGEAG